MAFDDSTGGIDRRAYHSPHQSWGTDFGDHSPKELLKALAVSRERAEVDRLAQVKYQERRARIAADATRSRSAPIEARLRREQEEKDAANVGSVMAQAFTKARNRDKKR